MITVNSLSGGKTSSYIAANYPADIDVFALVCIDDHNAGMNNIDPKIRQMVNDKLQKYCSNYPEFLSTAEDQLTLKAMFDLEQHIGREIIWVRGVDFYQAIRMKQLIPNRTKRFCTTILKIQPIFELLFIHFSLPCLMRIGYRYDEKHRAEDFRESFMYSNNCEYQVKSNRWINRWVEIPFRVGSFPLVESEVVHADVIKYWSDKGIVFPLDSNCQFCFWKNPNQLKRNFKTNPNIMHSAMIMEAMNDNRFHDNISMHAIRESGLQLDLFDLNWSGCHGGYCSN